ncbi:MAG: hypothetical protein ABSA54_22970 [Terriglobales bacterium]|jgi:hypothetical protein
MSKFTRLLRRRSIIHLAIAWALIVVVPVSLAEPSTPLDKHARKIEKRLAKYRAGAFLEVDFRDSSQSMGSLGALSAASFQFTDAANNLTQTHLYAEVARVKKAKEYIGEGSEPKHHVRLLVLVLIGAGVAAACVAGGLATR